MWARRRWSGLGVCAIAGCVDVPPHDTGSIDAPTGMIDAFACVTDADCDGDAWPATAPHNPAANDCNDTDAAIHPGAVDDPGDTVDEDCSGDAARTAAEGVGDTSTAELHSDSFWLQFGLQSGMPSRFAIGGPDAENDILGLQPAAIACRVNNEEGIGVSLYPALAVHGRPDPGIPVTGAVTFDGDGPARASAVVTWSVVLDGPETCSVPTTVAYTARFTALPLGRLIRADNITLTTSGGQPTGTCMGCSGNSSPILTTYIAVIPELDQLAIDEAPREDFPASISDGESPHRFCASAVADPRKLGVVFAFEDAVGYRLLTMDDGVESPTHAFVLDFVRSMSAPAVTYRGVTAMYTQVTGGDCSPEMWESMAEYQTPTTFQNLAFDRATALYLPTTTPTGGRFSFRALADNNRGFGVRLGNLGNRGVTVWRDDVRIYAGDQYLVQREDDGSYTLWFFTAQIGSTITISGPGSEPEPPR
jgi:hypothetical protein